MATINVGDQVFYSPHEDHALDPTAQGDTCFHFVHTEGPVGKAVTGGHGRLRKGRDGKLRTRNGDGHAVRHNGPRSYWPATVVHVNADGSADLEIKHPIGCVTLLYPDRGLHPNAPGVKHDAGKAAHTFHLAGE